MPPADAPGFCKEICRFQRPKSGAVNAKTKSILAFTIYNHMKQEHRLPKDIEILISIAVLIVTGHI